MLSLTWEEHGNVKFGMKEPEWILQLGIGMKTLSADPPFPPCGHTVGPGLDLPGPSLD